MGLYLPGSELDGLTVEQAHRRMTRLPVRRTEQPDRSAVDQGQKERRDPARSAAGQSRSDSRKSRTRRADHKSGSNKRVAKRERNHRAAKGRHTVLSAFARMQIYQLLAVLGALVAFYLAYRFGWI